MLNKSSIITMLVPYALELQKKFNIIPSVCIAQAILETGWLRHYSGNNLFGIKWIKDCGYDSIQLQTFEWLDGVKTPMVCLFRRYENLSQSFLDYGNLLISLKRYSSVISAENYIDACYELYRCGYCTDPSYPKKLISIIENNGLYKYDSNDTSQKDSTYNQVLSLQKNLNRLGINDFDNHPLVEDGVLGSKTQSSINKLRVICALDHEYSSDEALLKLTGIILKYSMYFSGT